LRALYALLAFVQGYMTWSAILRQTSSWEVRKGIDRSSPGVRLQQRAAFRTGHHQGPVGFGTHPTACSANAAIIVQGMSAKTISHQPTFAFRISNAEIRKEPNVSAANVGSLVRKSRKNNASPAGSQGKSGAPNVVIKTTGQDAGSVHCGRAAAISDPLAA
jgi:hypothetical protein